MVKNINPYLVPAENILLEKRERRSATFQKSNLATSRLMAVFC